MDKIRDKILQYEINRSAAKIFQLLSGKAVKHEYLTVEEIISLLQRKIIKEAKSSYSLPGKALKKQTKTIDKHLKNK